MADQNQSDNDEPLTKPKKPRSEAQKAATEKMRAKLSEKQVNGKLSNNDEKKLFLKAVKDKLNNAPPPPSDDDESEVEPEEAPTPKKSKKQESVKMDVKEKSKPKPKPKVVEESESESEEEVIVIKKKKKPKKKTIIIEESSDEEDHEDEPEPEKVQSKQPVRQPRSQQHKNSKIMVQRAQQQMYNDMVF
jgi:hypothetical protein